MEYNRLLLFGDNSDIRKKIKPFLTKGRFVYIKNFGIGIVIDYCKINNDKIADYNYEKKLYEIKDERKNIKNENPDSIDKLLDFNSIYLLIHLFPNYFHILDNCYT